MIFKGTSTTASHDCAAIFGLTGSGNIYMCGMKIELGHTLTKYMMAESEYANAPTVSYKGIIRDASGYGRDGILYKTFEAEGESPRYSASTHLLNANPSANADNGAYIVVPLKLEGHNAITFAWWGKHKTGYNGGWHGILSTSVNAAPTDYNTTTVNHRDNGFDVCNVSGTCVRTGGNLFVANAWHHYALVYNGTSIITYRDGAQVTSASQTGALKMFDKIFINYSKAGDVFRQNDGWWSDFRVYATALSVDDIKALYNVGAAVDNGQKIHTYLLTEEIGNLIPDIEDATGSVTNTYYIQKTTSYNIMAGKNYLFSVEVESTVIPFNVSVGYGRGTYSRDITTKAGFSNGVCQVYFTAPSSENIESYGSTFCFRSPRYSSQQTFTYSYKNARLTLVDGHQAAVSNTAKITANNFVDGPLWSASFYNGGDVSAADLIEI